MWMLAGKEMSHSRQGQAGPGDPSPDFPQMSSSLPLADTAFPKRCHRTWEVIPSLNKYFLPHCRKLTLHAA